MFKSVLSISDRELLYGDSIEIVGKFWSVCIVFDASFVETVGKYLDMVSDFGTL